MTGKRITRRYRYGSYSDSAENLVTVGGHLSRRLYSYPVTVVPSNHCCGVGG
jgi:hypothetical protein